MSRWFNRQTPYTGTGDKPKGGSLPAVVKIVFRTAKGKAIPPAPPAAKKRGRR